MKNNSKRKRNNKIIKIVTILIVVFFSIYILGVLTRNVSLYFMKYAKSEALELVNLKINNVIREETFSILKDNELFYVTKNDDNEIEMIDYNTYEVNLFLNKVSEDVQEGINELEKDNFLEIPLFLIFNNPLISSMGPDIPVKLRLTNVVYSNVEIKLKEYGVNNSLLEMYILLEVNIRVILPIISDVITIENEIPVSYKIINGKIPQYYGNGISSNSSIYSFPIE